MPLLKKISKKHLKVGARTWRPPDREHLTRSSSQQRQQHSSSETEKQGTSTIHQTEPTPVTPSQPPVSEPSELPPQTQSKSQTASSFNSLPPQQDTLNQRNSTYSQSLNDAHKSYRSLLSSSEHIPHSTHEPAHTELNSQSYPLPQPDLSSHHDHDIMPSLHDPSSISQLGPPPPRTHDYVSSSGRSEMERERLKIAEAENQAALLRSEAAAANLAAILKSEEAQLNNEPSQHGTVTLSDTDIKLQQARAQIEECERKLQEIRQEKEAFEMKEKATAMRELELQQLLQKEREKHEEDIKRAQEDADRTALQVKQHAAEELRRELEAIRREAEEQEKRRLEEQAEQARIKEEQLQLQLEQEREEEEAKIQAEIERVAQEARAMEAAEAQRRSNEEAQRLAERNAKLAIRGLFEEKERAMRNVRHHPCRRIVDQIRSMPQIHPVSYAHIYSSPLLGGYSLPQAPPTPHLVPEQVRKAAQAIQRMRESERRKAQLEHDLALQHEQARLWEEQQHRDAEHRESHRSVDRRDGLSNVDERLSRSTRSHHIDQPDHNSDYASHAAQSSHKEYSKDLHQPSWTGSVDRRDVPSNAHTRPSRSARTSHLNTPIHTPDQKSQAVQPVLNDNSPNHTHHRQRAHSVGRRDGLSHVDTRITQSARPAHLDYSAPMSDLGSQAPQVDNNSSLTQPPTSELSLLSRVKVELEQREREHRKIEDNMMAKVLAAYDQAIAKAEAQAPPPQDRDQAVSQEDRIVGPSSHPFEQAESPTLAAKRRAAEIAAHFNSTRRRKTSMPHTARHPRVTSHLHQRFNSTETASVAPSGTISEPESALDHVVDPAGSVLKDIESSCMLPVEHSSPISYLENHPRGRLLKLKGDQLARDALDVIAKDLGAVGLRDIRLRDPVVVDASRVNFSAQGIAVIPTNRSSAGGDYLDDCNLNVRRTPRQPYHDPGDPSHEPSPAHPDHRVQHTPALSNKSEPFDNSEPLPASPPPHQPSKNVDASVFSKRTESQKPKGVERKTQTLVGPSAYGQSHRSATHAHFNDDNPQHKAADLSANHRGRSSPRVLEEEKYFDGFAVSEKAAELPLPPRFVTPKVTLQSPSDTTSPSNGDHNSFYATPKPVGTSSTSHECSSPTKQSTSQIKSSSIQHEAQDVSHHEKHQINASPQGKAPLEPSPTAPPVQDQSPIPTDIGSTSRVTNTESFKPSRSYASATNSPIFRVPPSPQVKTRSSHINGSPTTPRQSTFMPTTSSLPECDLSKRTQRSASRNSWISHPDKSSPTSSTGSPTTSTSLIHEGTSEAGRTFNYQSHGLPRITYRDSPSANKRSSSRAPLSNVHHGKSDSTDTIRCKNSVMVDGVTESRIQVPLLTESREKSHSALSNDPQSPGRAEGGIEYTDCLYSSPATILQDNNNVTPHLPDLSGQQTGTKALPVVSPQEPGVRSSTQADDSESHVKSIQASVNAAMASVEQKVKGIVPQVSESVRALDQPLQLKEKSNDDVATSCKTPIPAIRLWSPRENNDYGSAAQGQRRFDSGESAAPTCQTPGQVPLTLKTPCERPLPPPTPREYPLPDSPHLYEWERSRRTRSEDLKNLASILRPFPERSATLSSSSSSSSSAYPWRDKEHCPRRLSRVWNGEEWDAIHDDLVQLAKPITPVPFHTCRYHPHLPLQSSTLREEINSLPLIELDDVPPN
ncbi:hypothetical protein VP01_141g4 [Puccinia sorghi]|uniref:Uncharacterized protein n=1 Tax=Puccinia sorghi TaxID=27349 RepID=A0A0L6VKM3_9BASI|nr:hypothetical protein VP01_141g4 [Puccinia sorghi]